MPEFELSPERGGKKRGTGRERERRGRQGEILSSLAERPGAHRL